MISLNDYQAKSRQFAKYPNLGENLVYATLGLTGEAGEFADNIKKSIRDDGGVLTDIRKQKAIDELGDVLWYVANCATEMGIFLEDIALRNIEKLVDRRLNGKRLGSG